MSDISTLALVLVPVAVIGVVFVDQLMRRPVLAVGLTLAATVLESALGPALQVSAGTARIGATDGAFALLTAAAAGRLLRNPDTKTAQRMALALGGLAVLSLVRGLPVHGEVAVNDFRTYLYLLGPVLYFSTVELTAAFAQRLVKLLTVALLALTGVVLLRWAGAFGGVNLGPLDARYDHAIRALSGPQTFIFTEGFFVMLPAWIGREHVRGQRALAVAFLALTILLNRRTVWLALAAGFLVFAVRNRRWSRRIAPVAASVGIVAAAAGLLLPSGQPAGSDHEVAQSATDTGTLEWRIAGWEALLADRPNGPAILVGEPFGSGFEREIDGRVIDANPHNFYLETLLRLGIFGVLLLGGLFLLGLRGASGRRFADRDLPLPRDALMAIVAAQAVWALTWPPGLEQGMFLGLAAGAATARSRFARPPERSRPAEARTGGPGRQPLRAVR